MFHQEIIHLRIEMVPGIPTINSMVLIRIQLHIELNVCFYQGSDHIDCVLYVDIVVTCAMDDKVLALDLVNMVDGRLVIIAIRILPGQPQCADQALSALATASSTLPHM